MVLNSLCLSTKTATWEVLSRLKVCYRNRHSDKVELRGSLHAVSQPEKAGESVDGDVDEEERDGDQEVDGRQREPGGGLADVGPVVRLPEHPAHDADCCC